MKINFNLLIIIILIYAVIILVFILHQNRFYETLIQKELENNSSKKTG